MKFHSILPRLAVAVVLGLSAATAFAGAVPAVDGYYCLKVKDLKLPAALVATPDPATVLSILSPANSCDVGKMTSLCVPASQNGSPINQPFVAQCCFKVKCIPEAPTGFVVSDTGNGAATFVGTVETGKKAKTMCVPCDMTLAP
jgi:hypothetical protein